MAYLENDVKGREEVPLFPLIFRFSQAMDCTSSSLNNHHWQVSYIAVNIARDMGFSQEQIEQIFIAALFLDIGTITLKERLKLMEFDPEVSSEHAFWGYLLLRKFPPFQNIASFIKYHHVLWREGRGMEDEGERIPFESHILHLSDRIAILIKGKQNILAKGKEIIEKIRMHEGKRFAPEIVEVFVNLSQKEKFWLDLVSPYLPEILSNMIELPYLSKKQLLEFSILLSRIVDFKSTYTASHSSGVATVAEMLGRFMGFSEKEYQLLKIAGYLHDIGKIMVPSEILEKPGKLTDYEFNLIKAHSYYTFRILEGVPNIGQIPHWAGFHHERLDGSGYPFHLDSDSLTLGSRIMAVADVFTAITEGRPYREEIPRDRTMGILVKLVQKSALDANVVGTLQEFYEEINYLKNSAQAAAIKEYMDCKKRLKKLI